MLEYNFQFGFVISCGFIGSVTVTELPKNLTRTSAIVYVSVLGVVTAIVMVSDIITNL